MSKAEEHLRRAIDKKPDYADAKNNLGIVLAGRKAWDEAIREFEAAAANVMYTTPERAYFNLGEAYRVKGDPANAEGAYRRALRANERYAPAYIALSALLGGQGKWKDAAPSSPGAWRSFPTTPRAGWIWAAPTSGSRGRRRR